MFAMTCSFDQLPHAGRHEVCSNQQIHVEHAMTRSVRRETDGRGPPGTYVLIQWGSEVCGADTRSRLLFKICIERILSSSKYESIN